MGSTVHLVFGFGFSNSFTCSFPVIVNPGASVKRTVKLGRRTVPGKLALASLCSPEAALPVPLAGCAACGRVGR